jgi:UDP-N-acetylglucosamine 2-epimerase
MVEQYVGTRPSAYLIDNLGTQNYFSFMSVAKAMVGNSSSGIIEAPSFKLPVVNIGNRQAGRIKGINVIDTGYTQNDILNGLKKALSPQFHNKLIGMPNPYGSGNASERILEVIKCTEINDNLIIKSFWDVTSKKDLT